MKRPIKFGIFGLGRGFAFIKAVMANNGCVVAACDRDPKKIEKAKTEGGGKDVAYYTDFDAFLEHPGLEAIFLCNTFDQHAAFAIKALEKNIHVLSECTSNATMAEGVALVRAAEKSKAIYMLAEQYPYMKFNLEMRRLFQNGSLGKLLYAEGEYNHPTPPNDPEIMRILRPYEKHWRNYTPRTYYITHSLGPLMYITGALPVRVTALPVFAPEPPDSMMGLSLGDRAAIITCLNDDDSVYRVTGCAAFGAADHSYRICGTKGQAENLRDGSERLLLRYNPWDAPEGTEADSCYETTWNDKDAHLIETFGHGGGDFLVIREFFDCINNGKPPFFDVYRATNMASVAILAHRSVLQRGVPYDIPDFRREEDRIKYQDDFATPYYGPNGEEPTVPCCSRPDFKPKEEDLERYRQILAGRD